MLNRAANHPQGRRRGYKGRSFPFSVFSFLFLVLGLVACSKLGSKIGIVDTQPLEHAGMASSAVRQLLELEVTKAEVVELAHAKQAGLPDGRCVELLQIARARNKPFTDGEEIAMLLRSGMKEEAVLELARLDQLGAWAGDVHLMRLASVPDSLILALAHRRAKGLPALSGGSLARLINAGLSDWALHELISYGITDGETDTILDLRRRGRDEAQIVHRYAPR